MGVGSKGIIPADAESIEAALEMGIDWSLREGYAWPEDKGEALDREEGREGGKEGEGRRERGRE